MASGSNPQRARQRVQDDDRVDPSTPQRGTPSSTRLANVPKQAVEKASKSLRKNISPEDDDDEILNDLIVVWTRVQEALEQDPNLKKYLASKEKFRDNVTRKGEKKFIDSLRAMAANSDTQGSKAWEDLFEDGRYIVLFGSKHSDRTLHLEVFLKEIPAPDVNPLRKATTSAEEGTQSLQSLSTLLILSDNSYRARVATSLQGRSCSGTAPEYLELPR
jgi:hypothetical protein